MMITLLNKSKNKLKYIILLFIIILSAIRFLNLDNDVSDWNISQFQPQDEYGYTILSCNMYNYGKLNISDEFAQDQTQGLPQMKGTVLENFLTYISFLIFGKTYLGLRFFSVVLGILSIILLYLTFQKINKYDTSKGGYLLSIFLSIYMVFDFTFLMTTRIAEPTIFRSFFILLTFYLFILFKDKKYIYFFLGFAATFSVIFVYFVNFFFLAAVGLLVLVMSFYRKSFKILLQFLVGVLLVVIIGELYYRFIWDSTLFKSINEIFRVYSYGRLTTETPTLLNMFAKYKSSASQFFQAHIFVYSPILLGLFLTCLPSYLHKTIKSKSVINLFAFLIVLMMYLQTIFVDDYTSRKLTTIFPFILYIIFVGIKNFYEFNVLYLKKIYIKVLLVFCYLASFLIALLISNNFLSELVVISTRLNHLVRYISIASTLLILCILLYILYSKTLKLKYFIFVLCGTLLIPNFILSYKYVYNYNFYTEKSVMLELNDVVGNNYILGAGHGYGLYNNTMPVLSYYDSYRGEDIYNDLFSKYVNDDKVNYVLTVGAKSSITPELILLSKKYILIYSIKRSFTENGVESYVGLYKKVN